MHNSFAASFSPVPFSHCGRRCVLSCYRVTQSMQPVSQPACPPNPSTCLHVSRLIANKPWCKQMIRKSRQGDCFCREVVVSQHHITATTATIISSAAKSVALIRPGVKTRQFNCQLFAVIRFKMQQQTRRDITPPLLLHRYPWTL